MRDSIIPVLRMWVCITSGRLFCNNIHILIRGRFYAGLSKLVLVPKHFLLAECNVGNSPRHHFHHGRPFFKENVLTLQKSLSILNIQECDSFKELRDKYLDLAKVYHPDSGDKEANAEKFSELQEAYKVVHAHLKKQVETDLHEEVDEEEFESDYVAPQHRQFLNFGGFGFGPPSQREKVYQKHKVLKAHEKVVNHKVKRHAQSGTDGKSLTLRQKRAVKKNKVTNAIERLVEDLIQESMAKGDFDNLPRKGQPLPSKTQYCPFIDINQHNLNQVLVNNGVVPEFVALEKEIRDLLADSKTELLKARLKLGPEPLNTFNKKKWDGLLLNFEKSIKMINKKVLQFNLVVPLLRMQKVQISAEKEVKKVVEKYEQKLQEMNSLEESEMELAKTENTTYVYAFLNQVSEKVFNRIFKQSFGRD